MREESVNFDTTENLYIEGDNLEVLKLLQESYLGKVKMIYIDPPYNTGNDFVYRDNFAQDSDEYKADSGMTDELGNRLVANPETAGRYHSDWLTMMYPRLKLARNLLTDDGVLFISIDDNEVHNLRKMCDEVFGEQNFVGQIAVINNLKGRNDSKNIATAHEYLVLYSKIDFLANGLPLTDEQRNAFNLQDEFGNQYQLRDLRKRGRPDRREDRPNMYFPIFYNPITKECTLDEQKDWIAIYPLRGDGSDGRWRWGKERVGMNLKILEPKFSKLTEKWGIEHRVYLNPNMNPTLDNNNDEDEDAEERSSKSKSFWIGGEISSDVGRRELKNTLDVAVFDYPKSIEFVKKTIYLGSSKNDIILDFFSGSATTAHAVMQLNAEDGGNRKFIMVQLPEKTDEKSEAYKAGYKNICEIGKERIRRAGKKLTPSNSPEGGEQATLFDGTADAGSAQLLPSGEAGRGLDVGFRVYRLDSSNMQDVYYRPQDYKQDMMTELFANHIKPDRTADDLVAQVMLDWGLPLSLPIEQTTIAGKTVYKVAGNALYCCFDEGIDEVFVRALVSPTTDAVTTDGVTPSHPVSKELPLRIVFHDYAFANDTAKENVRQLLKQLSGETEMRVI